MYVKVYTLKQVLVLFILVLFLTGCFAILADRLLWGVPKLPINAVEVMAVTKETPQASQTGQPFSMTLNQPKIESASTEPSNTPTPTEVLSNVLKIEVIRNETSPNPRGKVLIYHTHTYEAYESSEVYTYTPTSKWRTNDPKFNVVRVGDELVRLLTTLGYDVVHDTGEYEPPVLSTSYARSLQMLKKRTSAGESYDLYIDIHRDAYSESMKNSNTVSIAGTQVAKLMMLIGKGTGQTGAGFSEKPQWESNFAIAEALTEDLNAQFNGLSRRISIKTGRFNQHIAPKCVLIEVGNNKNTLDEALAAIPYLADAIDNVLDKLMVGAL